MGIFRKLYQANSDEELMQLISKGNAKAFDELYKRYGQKVFSYFFRMLWKNKELAEDCTQELFVKLFNNAAGFDSNKQFSTWMYSMASNMCKNEYRQHEMKSTKLKWVKEATSISPANPDMKRFKEAVHSSVQDLPEEKKQLYILRFQENLSVPQIAEIMNMAEGTIKSRLFYLMKEMKEKLNHFENIITYP
jgi:RNA polymerase sigma-70 factor (ECF subfamily)